MDQFQGSSERFRFVFLSCWLAPLEREKCQNLQWSFQVPGNHGRLDPRRSQPVVLSRVQSSSGAFGVHGLSRCSVAFSDFLRSSLLLFFSFGYLVLVTVVTIQTVRLYLWTVFYLMKNVQSTISKKKKEKGYTVSVFLTRESSTKWSSSLDFSTSDIFQY